MTDAQLTLPDDDHGASRTSARFSDRIARRLVFRALRNLKIGQIDLIESGTRYVFGNTSAEETLRCEITVCDPRVYIAVASAGSLGAAEAYIEGCWRCDDLTKVVRVFVRNEDLLEKMDTGLARLTVPFRKILQLMNRNTKAGSRRNIAAHYDLGNDFFRLWLDDAMMYSSAVFERPEMNLNQASQAKLDRICRKLELTASDHVLEIGTGWGGFAMFAAANYGCRVTTTTISRQQYEHARARVDEAGLGDRITVLLKDYRDLDGQYDKLVSIEMVEAVGHQYLDRFFRVCGERLKPHGMMMLQAITIQDQRYTQAVKTVDFIKRYIFPGGFLPSLTAITASATRASDMRVFHLEDIGEHYAKTLRAWQVGFSSNLDRIRELGYPDTFLRMWEYYFCYCEGAFLERAIGNAQLLFVKPRCRRGSIVPRLGHT